MTRGKSREDGSVKLGRYELLHPLGAGGMAEIFKARAVGPAGFQQEVVIKRILATHGRDAEFIRMFEDEAKILACCTTRTWCRSTTSAKKAASCSSPSNTSMAPRVAGPAHVAAANQRMPPGIAAFIAREVCRALDYVHDLEDG